MIGFFNNDTNQMVGSINQAVIQDELIARNTPENCTAFEIEDDGQYYLVQGIPVKIPEAPSADHIFDTLKGVWVLNTRLIKKRISIKRNKKLADTDWTQLPDVPITTKQAWATYRQNLRDITDQEGYPNNIIWPQEPQ